QVDLTFQSQVQHFVHSVHEANRDFLLNIGGNVRQILFIVAGQDDRLAPGAMGGENLLLNAADGKHFASQRDLARHGQIAAHRNLGERTDDRGRQSDSGGGTILGDGAFRDVDMNIQAAVEVGIQPEARRSGAHIAHRCLARLLHNVAQLSGEDQLALTGHDARLNVQDLSADLRPGQTGGQADFVSLLRSDVPELNDAEVIFQVLFLHGDLKPLAVFDDFPRHLTADVGNLAL